MAVRVAFLLYDFLDSALKHTESVFFLIHLVFLRMNRLSSFDLNDLSDGQPSEIIDLMIGLNAGEGPDPLVHCLPSAIPHASFHFVLSFKRSYSSVKVNCTNLHSHGTSLPAISTGATITVSQTLS